MLDTPLVSIIIPCYSDVHLLDRAISSCLNQTYSNIEIIVINDNSPMSDKITDIVRLYPSIIYVSNSANLGLAASRNFGFAHSNGDFISFLDADDLLHPQKIEIQLSLYRPGTVLTCYTQCFYNAVPTQPVISAIPAPIVFKSPFLLLFRNVLLGAAIFLDRQTASKTLYNPALRSCEDWDLYLRLLKANYRVLIIPLPLYLYYQNINGLSKANIYNISYWETTVLYSFFSTHSRYLSSTLMLLPLSVHFFRIFLRLMRQPSKASLRLLVVLPFLFLLKDPIRRLSRPF